MECIIKLIIFTLYNMGKEEKLGKIENPFGGFNVLKGEFVTPADEKTEDDIKDGTEDIIEEEDELLEDIDDNMKKADEELEKIANKQKKAAKKETSEEVIEEQEEEEDNDSNDSTEDSSFGSFTRSLYEKGILDFNDEDEDFEDSEEGIEKLINKTVGNRIDKWAKSLPEEYSKFLEFVENGGSPKQFLDVYYGNQSWEDLDLENESNQKMAVRESLRLAGESAEDIDEIIDEWEVNGSLEKRAKSALNKLQKLEKQQKDELVEIQKQNQAKKEQQQKEYWDNFKKELYSKDEISGFKMTPKSKDKLWDFMTNVGRDGKTAYEKAIEANKDSSYLFAYLAMNNFDSSKLEKQVETKVSNKLSGVLKNYSKSTKNKISSGGSEFRNDENPFSGFKTIK